MVMRSATWWVRATVESYVGEVVGIVVAAAVSGRVSVTPAGAFAAAAVLWAFGLLAVVLGHLAIAHGLRRQEKLWPIPTMLFLFTVPFFARPLVAALVVPGFDMRGVWGYVLVLAATYGVADVIDSLVDWLTPVAQVAPHDEEGEPERWRGSRRPIPFGPVRFVLFALVALLCALSGFYVGAVFAGVCVIAALRYNARVAGRRSRWRIWSVAWILTWSALGVLSLALGWGRWLGYGALAIAFVAVKRFTPQRDPA